LRSGSDPRRQPHCQGGTGRVSDRGLLADAGETRDEGH
jgi:hypothetical protein